MTARTPVTVMECANCGRKNRLPAAAPGHPQCGNCHRPLPWVADAGDETFAEVAEAASIPVVVDFWAPWCGPCRIVSPVLEQLAGDLAGRVKLVKVNADEAPMLSDRFAIRHIPYLMVLVNGRVAAQRAGAVPAAELRQWVEETIASAFRQR